jgi:hypothetical protein
MFKILVIQATHPAATARVMLIDDAGNCTGLRRDNVWLDHGSDSGDRSIFHQLTA